MLSKTEISEIKNYAVKHICPHYGVNEDLDSNPKVYVKSDDSSTRMSRMNFSSM